MSETEKDQAHHWVIPGAFLAVATLFSGCQVMLSGQTCLPGVVHLLVKSQPHQYGAPGSHPPESPPPVSDLSAS